jgi:hypothetical protein
VEQAKNLLSDKLYKVKRYLNIVYIATDNGYIILTKTPLTFNEIDYYLRYSYYDINGVIYDSFYTNDYKAFYKDIEQLSLF